MIRILNSFDSAPWDESKHKRDNKGRFALMSGRGGSTETKAEESQTGDPPAENISVAYRTTPTLRDYDDLQQIYQEDYSDYLKQIRQSYSNQPDQLAAIDSFVKRTPHYESVLREALQSFDFSSNTDSLAIMGILADGRMKSQIESGQTHGYKDIRMRKAVAADLFNGGTPLSIEDKDYEIYGYLDGAPRASIYGSCRIVFKKDRLMDRTTITVGDSLEQRASGNHQIPTLATAPRIFSASLQMFDSSHYLPSETLTHAERTFRSIQQNGHLGNDDYVELQFHGGITLEDIEYIEVPANDWRRPIIDGLARKKGVRIKWLT